MIAFDLFAGAGGASEGVIAASLAINGERPADLAAVNHWPVAIATHRRNHPWARHYCQDVRRVNPRVAMGMEEIGGSRKKIKIGVAGVDCTDHSNAKGGKPRDAGLRSLAWDVHRWARLVEPENILIENVPEFTRWGPLYPADYADPKKANRPIPERRGEYFREFVASMKRLGYQIDYRLLRCCDYGDPTSRRRLFIQAKREDCGKIVWPEQTHGEAGNLFGLPAYRTAREIIDWDIEGKSIFGRKKALADKTMERIAAGVKQFCGDPFTLGIGGPSGRQVCKGIDQPFHTVLTHNHDYLVEPVMVPFFVKYYGGHTAQTIDAPIPTLTANYEHFALCQAFLLRYNDGGRVQSLDKPLTTLDTSNRFGLVQAFLVSYHGQDSCHSIDEPLRTLRTHDRFALAEVERELVGKGLVIVDIKMRMLEPHEMARAHSFGDDYQFEGNREEKVAQVGHSWPVSTATAICKAMITGEGIEA